MWELIQSNKRKSVVVFIAMAACLVLLGYAVGFYFDPARGAFLGPLIALGLWLVMCFVSYFFGDSILLSISNAKRVTQDVHPQLFNVVEEMKIAANLPAMPKIYIIDEPYANAFATGVSPAESSIAVTAGLLSRLNRDELQGVIAHEMSHVTNRDVLYMTLAAMMLGSMQIIAEGFLRGGRHSGSSRRYRSKSGGGGGGIAVLIVIVVVLLAPILARIFYFSLSRKREYLADACAVRLTRYPEGLASALEKIAQIGPTIASATAITAPMYIANPLKQEANAFSSLTSTHPPMDERIRILRTMTSAAYAEYESVFKKIVGSDSVIPGSGLAEKGEVRLREPFKTKEVPSTAKEHARQTGDLMRAVNHYAFLTCACGLKLKIPPDFNKTELQCPSCQRMHEVPISQLVGVAQILSGQMSGSATVPAGIVTKHAPVIETYTRTSKGWESFSCGCGKLLQLSPGFMGTHLACDNCGRKIKIE